MGADYAVDSAGFTDEFFAPTSNVEDTNHFDPEAEKRTKMRVCRRNDRLFVNVQVS